MRFPQLRSVIIFRNKNYKSIKTRSDLADVNERMQRQHVMNWKTQLTFYIANERLRYLFSCKLFDIWVIGFNMFTTDYE